MKQKDGKLKEIDQNINSLNRKPQINNTKCNIIKNFKQLNYF